MRATARAKCQGGLGTAIRAPFAKWKPAESALTPFDLTFTHRRTSRSGSLESRCTPIYNASAGKGEG